MGYDVERFVGGTVNNELICPICQSVLENAFETPCEHFFCAACIVGALAGSHTCPIDRQPLRTFELMQPSRLLLNLLAALEIKCDFQEQGCDMIVKLENLPKHLSECNFRPKEEITCGPGCSPQIGRRGLGRNLNEDLVKRVRCQNMEIVQLREDLSNLYRMYSRVKEAYNRLVTDLSHGRVNGYHS